MTTNTLVHVFLRLPFLIRCDTTHERDFAVAFLTFTSRTNGAVSCFSYSVFSVAAEKHDIYGYRVVLIRFIPVCDIVWQDRNGRGEPWSGALVKQRSWEAASLLTFSGRFNEASVVRASSQLSQGFLTHQRSDSFWNDEAAKKKKKHH